MSYGNRVLKIFMIVFSVQTFAQEDIGRKLKLDQNKQLRIDYKFNAWNKNPNVEDTASILLRDGNSGRLAKIELQETGKNSSDFVGFYSINFGSGDVVPEVYLPPQEMIKSAEQFKKLSELIKDGFLLRKPYFLRLEKNIQAITVYDTKDQALSAFEQYRLGLKGKAIVSNSVLKTQQNAELAVAAQKLAEKALQQEMQRVRMAELEKQKMEDLKKEQEALSEAQKLKRSEEAKNLAEQAMKLYQSENYVEAEKLFKKSSELDPANTQYSFQYGVTLYRNEKYNESLVVLGLARNLEANSELEKKFYMGLNHMKLKEFETAHDIFDGIKKTEDKNLSPSASFFNGVMDFQKEKYDPAKLYFEYVLDNSSDPRMDEQAEAYIEQIAQIKQFEANKAQKFILTGTLGMSYDSNVLLVSDTGEASAESGEQGLRTIYGFSFEYRPIYTEKHEFSAILSYSDILTKSTSFQDDVTFSDADPLTISLTTPYKWKGMAFQRGYQVIITPGMDMLSMNADGSGGREKILDSTYLKADQTFVMSDNWYSGYNFEYRNDLSLTDTTGDEDSSATKITLQTTQTLFLDKKKTQAYIGEASYSLNNAVGDNKTYNKFELAGSYMMPWKYETTALGRLGLINTTYPTHTESRKDNEISLTGALTKPINEAFTSSLSANYTLNSSNVDSSAYNKYSLTFIVTWNKGF